MTGLIQSYWWIVVIALIVFAVGYWAWARNRANKAQVNAETLDVVGTATQAPSDARSGLTDFARKAAPTADAGAVSDIVTNKPKIVAAVGEPDNLLQIKGIGPKLSALCQSLGITRFDQIAAWTPTDIAEVDQHLGTFRGRIARDGWVEQARLLAAGDVAAFETKFGKLDSQNN